MPKTKPTASRQKKVAPAQPAGEPRRLQAPKAVWNKPLSWRHRPPVPAYRPLPKARQLFMHVLRQLRGDWRLFGGIIFIYGLLNLVLVRGLAGSSDLSDLKNGLDSVFSGVGGKLASASISFASLLASSGSSNTASSGTYQSILLTICSLAFIWALRQSSAARRVRIRDSFYQGMYPLIPYLLVFLLLGLQLVPLVAGAGLYGAVVGNGIAVYLWEKALFLLLFLGLALWSLRMVTATFFALYIVALPDMTPLRAYRSARQLVYGRRLLVWRKLLFLPLILAVLALLIELPLILFITPIAAWIFFVISMLMLPISLGYLYRLYREML